MASAEPEPRTPQNEVEANRERHRELFEEYLIEMSKDSTTSYVIDRAKEEKIKSYLSRTVAKPDANFTHYIKKHNLSTQMVNGKQILYRDHKEKNLPVAIKEDFFDILYTSHSLQRGHVGIQKMDSLMKDQYHGIPRSAIKAFIGLCPICNLKTVQQSQPRVKPIRSDDFRARFQIDLVDMRHNPCTKAGRSYKWIAHVEDHFTKFHVIWALEQKSAEEVVDGLESRVFGYFGLPLILQSDNGREFKNSLMAELIDSWEGNCKIVHGRPRHPQSQGLVEQANGTMERMLASMMKQFSTSDWVAFLPKVMYNLNTMKSSSTKFMPYEVVFLQAPNLGNSKKIVEIVPSPEGEEEIEVRNSDLEQIAPRRLQQLENETQEPANHNDEEEELVTTSKSQAPQSQAPRPPALFQDCRASLVASATKSTRSLPSMGF